MEHLVNKTKSSEQSALDSYKVTQDSIPEVELDHSNSIGNKQEERQWQRDQEEIAMAKRKGVSGNAKRDSYKKYKLE